MGYCKFILMAYYKSLQQIAHLLTHRRLLLRTSQLVDHAKPRLRRSSPLFVESTLLARTTPNYV